MNHLKHNTLILIGASTGGPGHIQKIIESLSLDHRSPLVIAQHIADEYVPSFVNRLQSHTVLKIMAVEDQLPVLPGHVYICSLSTQVVISSAGLVFKKSNAHTHRYNPDIDVLFTSAADLIPTHNVLAIILTGIGDDGARGCKALHEKGATCIAESESSAVVYGMPMQVKAISTHIKIQSLDEIIQTINVLGA